MTKIHIAASERSPEVDFDFAANKFALRGESFPENVAAFYGEPMDKQKAHLAGQDDLSVVFDFELIYFNSSSAKVLMNLFDILDAAAEQGNQVTVNWHYEEDDDTMAELGEELGEDLVHAKFTLIKIAV